MDANSSRRTRASAGGKVILLGEHAVVYGVPALALGIERGARAHATHRSSGGVSSLAIRGSGGWSVEVSDADPERSDVARAFAALVAATRAAMGGRAAFGAVHVDVEADLPPAGGLGCSAALGVAIVRALDPHLGDDAAAMRAMEWERVFHGNPSGIDAAVAARGGCVLFERGREPLPVRVRGELALCVGHSGSPSSTRAMVEAVARLRARKPEGVDASFRRIGALVLRARDALRAGDRAELGVAMDENQKLLAELLVSTPDIERMCAVARNAGALGAKLTGAGGGGCVVALAPSAAIGDAILEAWRRDGFTCFLTRVAPAAEEGPRIAAVG
jgi:mevalonate kinase